MNKITRIGTALVACALMSTAFGTPAHAASAVEADRRDPVKIKFQYDARDLATRQGSEKVYRKLVREVRRHCTATGSLAADLRRVDRRCMAELTGNAVARIGSTHLAAIHQKVDHTGERVEVASAR